MNRRSLFIGPAWIRWRSIMKLASFLSKAFLIAGLAGLGLMPVNAHDPRMPFPQLGGTSPLLKFANGRRIVQVYVQPASEKSVSLPTNGPVPFSLVQSLCEKQAPLGDAGYKLRPRLVTRLRGAVQAVLQPMVNARAAVNDGLTVFDFDVVYGELPVVHANRTVMVQGGRTVAIRDRNPPHGLAKPVFPRQASPANLAWSAAAKNSTDTLARLYPRKAHRLMADPRDPEAHLVLWPDEGARQLHLAWALTLRSTSRTEPFLRRYWVSAAQPGQILDFEDLIFYEQPPVAQTQPQSPWHNPFGSFLKPSEGSRSSVTITDWPVLPRVPAAQYSAAPTMPQGANQAAPWQADPRRADGPASPPTAIFSGSVSGMVTGTMWDTSPYSGVVSRPLSGVEITVTRATGIASTTYSDLSGRYYLAGVNGLATVRATLKGPACKIVNEGSKNNEAASFTGRVGRGTVDIDFPAGPSDEFKLAQNDAFYSVTRAYDFVKPYLPEHPSKVPQITTHVNVDSSCNAYYDRSDNTLNFFRSFSGSVSNDKSCPNTAYRDVVFHEYGHAVDDELGGILDGAYSEGFGDGLSILITHSPLVGTDFYGPGKNLRDARKVFLWPAVKDSEIHEAGQCYSGFCWELTQQLRKIYPEDRAFEVAKQLLMGAAVQNPKDIPDAVRLSFFVDAKLFPSIRAADESLHAAQLRAAANSRQLPIPKDSSNLSSPSLN